MNLWTKRFLSLLIFLICSTVIFLLTFFKYSLKGGKHFIQPSFNRPVLASYTPKTGDILMVHYLGHGMVGIPVAEHWPTHMGMVWVQENGRAVVLECTKFSAPALPNLLKETLDKERGVRAVPWDDYINSVDNVLYIREITKGSVDTHLVHKIISQWGVHIDFETRIADSMTFDLTVAIGFLPVWPKLSAWCAKAAKLHEFRRRDKQAFCSEFISRLLQKLGAIDPSYEHHYKVTPASFLKTVGTLEKLSLNSSLGLEWGEDRMLVRRA